MDIGDLHGEQVDQLAREIASPITGAQICRAAERTNTKDLDDKAGWSKEDRLASYLANVNRSGEVGEVLSILIEKLDLGRNDSLAGEIDDILIGSPYTLQHNGERYELATRTPEDVSELKDEHSSLIEEAAPLLTQARLKRASHLLAEGDYDNAIHDCRRALENLTVDTNYGSALADLDQAGIIEGNDWDEPIDWQALKFPYNYCSNVGSHGGSEAPEATAKRAELAYIYTQEAIVFLLRVAEKESLPESWDI
ncbi:hypothetical protein [Natrinema altunense]|uniref:hypothetical protein n=1 Tax=Natrinema altunense TaxID=222984 RepID=UPI0006777D99|nr:hypothetical protein [Natrinema altunense]